MFRVVIPARFASTRLPGKALVAIGGKPMIQWVYERARSSGAAEVLIATDDARIAAAGKAFGAVVEMTAASHQSGTDRIAEVARARGWGASDIVVNVQGDEPLMPPALIDQVAGLLLANSDAGMATLAAPLTRLEELLDPNVVKVVADASGRALYFSRAPIPWHRDGAPAGLASQRSFAGARRHIGIYAYRVSALLRLAGLAPTPLEQTEKLEQLRALENGIEIRVAEAAQLPGPDVNTPDDLERVAAALGAK
ncbi:MAG TPA: 3-deoxy-manno-octulosonate cytidylyltransferase [Steroidobacteraceae bacterium]|nr:3-deoxy-manno-octulosonate cytidylyltransferase [Steroidobacteraceae bacterium]